VSSWSTISDFRGDDRQQRIDAAVDAIPAGRRAARRRGVSRVTAGRVHQRLVIHVDGG
jgi:hypothetical protein